MTTPPTDTLVFWIINNELHVGKVIQANYNEFVVRRDPREITSHCEKQILTSEHGAKITAISGSKSNEEVVSTPVNSEVTHFKNISTVNTIEEVENASLTSDANVSNDGLCASSINVAATFSSSERLDIDHIPEVPMSCKDSENNDEGDMNDLNSPAQNDDAVKFLTSAGDPKSIGSKNAGTMKIKSEIKKEIDDKSLVPLLLKNAFMVKSSNNVVKLFPRIKCEANPNIPIKTECCSFKTEENTSSEVNVDNGIAYSQEIQKFRDSKNSSTVTETSHSATPINFEQCSEDAETDRKQITCDDHSELVLVEKSSDPKNNSSGQVTRAVITRRKSEETIGKDVNEINTGKALKDSVNLGLVNESAIDLKASINKPVEDKRINDDFKTAQDTIKIGNSKDLPYEMNFKEERKLIVVIPKLIDADIYNTSAKCATELLTKRTIKKENELTQQVKGINRSSCTKSVKSEQTAAVKVKFESSKDDNRKPPKVSRYFLRRSPPHS